MEGCFECGSDYLTLMSIGDGEFVANCENGHTISLPEGEFLQVRIRPKETSFVPEVPVYTPSQLREEARKSRARSLASARSNLAGHTAQQLFPFAEAHNYHPRDIQYIGGTMDYLILDGLHRIRYENRGPESLTVVLADVKSGRAKLSRAQRAVKRAMDEGRTRGECWTAAETDSGLSWSLGTR